jgi:predicted ATPase
LSAKKYAFIDIDVEIVDDVNDTAWRYRLVINQDSASRAVVREEKVYRDKRIVFERPNDDDKKDPLLLTYTHLEQVVVNKEFRAIGDFFRTISYQHLLPQVVRDPKGFTPTPVVNDPYGRDFLMRLWQTPKRTLDSRLTKINQALKVAVPQLVDLTVDMDSGGTPHLIGGYQHWRPNAARQYENQFSDGTLRLLGLLWSMFEGDGPLLLEEPEISLHSDVVRFLPVLFERIQRSRKVRRQVVISTHSAEILSNRGIAAEEVLLLEPGREGTAVREAQPRDKKRLLEGLSAAEVFLPRSKPANVDQLAFAFE